MSRPYLLASIPPVLRGVSFSHSDEQSLQCLAIQSWKDAGFMPISINTNAELKRYPDHVQQLTNAGVPVLSLEPPPHALFPDYLPPLKSALIKATAAFPDSTIGITNADTVFTDKTTEALLYQQQDLESFFVAHRTDVDSIPINSFNAAHCEASLSNAFVYRAGIDFVFTSSTNYKKALDYICPGLTFGLPWWDLYLPLALMACNLELHHLDPNRFLHIRHSDRWDESWWNMIGTKATSHMNLALQKQQVLPHLVKWRNEVNKVNSPAQTLKIKIMSMISRLVALTSGNQYIRPLDPQLLEIVNLTESLVCDIRKVDSSD